MPGRFEQISDPAIPAAVDLVGQRGSQAYGSTTVDAPCLVEYNFFV